MLGLRATLDDLVINVGTAADIRVSRNVLIASNATPPVIQAIPDLGTLAAKTDTGDLTIVDTSGGASGETWNVQDCTIFNAHASASTLIRVRVDDGTNAPPKAQATLLPGEWMQLLESGAWLHFDANGGLYPASFNSINIQDFSASGTYTPTPGMKHCIVIATGAGGGGGGADTSAGGSGDVGVGGGGGAGETRIGFFTAAQVGSSQTITINAAGTAGSTGGGNGGNGGTAVFGSLITANGGTGGTGSTSGTQDAQTTAGGAGGTGGSGGTIAITGGAGGRGIAGSVDGTIDIIFNLGGLGGIGFWGGGGGQAGAASNTLTTAANVTGSAGAARGSGGSGGSCNASTTGAAGGAGASGGIMIVEFV